MKIAGLRLCDGGITALLNACGGAAAMPISGCRTPERRGPNCADARVEAEGVTAGETALNDLGERT
jgi:hypothetical protein